MKTTSFRARTLACALLASTAYCGLTAAPAQAQAARQHRALDANGVDLTWGDFLMEFVEGSIGSGEGELALVRNGVWINGQVFEHEWDRITFDRIPLSGGGTRYAVRLGARIELFDNVMALPTGSTLSGAGGSFVYRTADGTQVQFGDPTGGSDGTPYCNGTQTSCSLVPTSVTSPNGKTIGLSWQLWAECVGEIGVDNPCTYHARLAAVSNSFGYEIRFGYATDGEESNTPPPLTWFKRTGATFHNHAVSANPQASVSYSYPALGVTEVTDLGGRVWRFTGNAATVTGIRRPGASSDTTSISYATGHVVTALTREGVTTNYARSVSGNTATMIVTNALSQQTTIVSDLGVGRPTSVTDPLSRTTAYQYDTSARLTRVTAPEGNYVQHIYDARGNVTQTQAVAKPGSGLATITISASYDASCASPVTCNQPNSTTDARGNVTDYIYDPNHGGVLSVTAPAPSSGAVRPQTRYSYTLTNGEYRLTGTSACQTMASCAGTADEVKTSLAYDANGNVISTSAGDGSGTLTATTAMTWDALGNLLTVDGPLAGSADTTRMRYNAARELVGTVSPDPDGGGALKHRAVRNSYTNGLLTKVEQGTVTDQSDGAWAAFSALEAIETGYDGNARPVTTKLVAGGTTHALTQTSYDALGRLECQAVRMNPAAFGSLPSSACTLGTQGSFGPDRITKAIYDAAGQVTQLRAALGTADEAAEAGATYRPNGQVETLTDGENNRTTYVYDGHDRLFQTQFPHPTKGAGVSNAADYEQLGYDAGGNVISRRLRDGQVIGFSYDALSRPTLKDLPGSEPDVSYGYDLLGRLTSAAQSGHALSFTYDALGRRLAETGPNGTVSSQYDVAGRRTRLTYPDVPAMNLGQGFFVSYDYLVTGEMSAVREMGASSGIGVLASFGYDDLGRRTSLARGNGTVTSYSYDPVSRLASLAHDLAGTTHDLALGFGYNPGGQIHAATRSNDLYAWQGHGSGTTGSAANGLNQVTTTGGASLSHDARGNMISDGTNSYVFSSENLLTQSIDPGGSQSQASFLYDPLMRLREIVSDSDPSNSKRTHDGGDLIMENLTKTRTYRYVHGPGDDEPLVMYYLHPQVSTRRDWYHADERGSIAARSRIDGTGDSAHQYDEFGAPPAAWVAGQNWGRFQYTGQYWLVEPRLYYYKARFYDPKLGRFLQTDPIGYGDGMNLYAYVKNDPVNFTDPSGLCSGKPNNLWDVFNGNTGAYLGTEVGETHSYSAPTGCEGGFGLFRRLQLWAPLQDGGGGSNEQQCLAGGSAAGTIAVPAPPRLPAIVGSAIRAGILRALGLIGSMLSLSGDSQQPRQFRHYGYSAHSANFTRGLRPGSFATTAEGPPLTGQQAQSLLALPARSSVPDAYYTVTVGPQTPVIGPSRVQPANGQPGGGIEYRFPQGTPPGSVGPPSPIPAC